MSAPLTPGWYPDEDQPDARRYWDGEHWGPSIPSVPSVPPVAREDDGTDDPAAPVDTRYPYRDRSIRIKGALLIVVMLLIAAAFLVFTKPHLWDRHPHHQHGRATFSSSAP